jgi:tetratricopeptide (TPR) repeat protein
MADSNQARVLTQLTPITGGQNNGQIHGPTRGFDEGQLAPMIPLTPLLPGGMLGNTRYRILGWLGEGGMGVVYEAEHVDLGRKVALKILRSEACRRPHYVDMFRSEARIVASMRSEFIVEIYDFAELPDGRALFTMELLQGATLHNAIAWGPLEVSRAIGVLRQVCKGLAAAHAAGVVHRDIKPENVFLCRRRDRSDAVRLLDFGVSAMLGDARRSAARVAGTPGYFAPELIAGIPNDARADLYALGCTAYEILLGRLPFEGDEAEMLCAHLEREPPRFAELAPGRTDLAPLEPVLRRCLAKDPADRYGTAGELEAALCEAQIAMGLITAWDDLELPEVEPAQRERLFAAMPDPSAWRVQHGRARKRAWQIGSAIAAAFVAGALALAWPTADRAARVDELVNAARHAAAQAYFIYPPPDQPDQPTAYDFVLQLEAMPGMDGFQADRLARELRHELAATLVRLGDRYWALDGGRVFAIDYYACALVFQPEHPTARERAVLTVGQIASLQDKAETHSFTSGELAAASPLLALAEDDEARRGERLAELEGVVGLPSATVGAELDRLLGDEVVITTARARARGPAPKPAASEPIAAMAAESRVPQPIAAPPVAATAQVEPDPVAPRPRVAVAPLLAEGRRALQRGDLDGAQRAFERALAADDRNASANGGLARVEFERGRYVIAIRHASRAVRSSPRDAELRILLGDALYKSYRYAEARDQYRKAKELGHREAAARVAKADAKLAQ